MKHVIKFKKAILNANWAGDYSVINDVSIINIFYNLVKERSGFKIKTIKVRARSSDLRSKVVICCQNNDEWNTFVVDFLEAFDGYIENISIK